MMDEGLSTSKARMMPGRSGVCLRSGKRFRLPGRSLAYGMGAALLASSLGSVARAQAGALVLEREGRVISLEPYAPNVLRITMSTERAAATAAPGDGFVAHRSAE